MKNINYKTVKNLDIEKCKSYDVANYGKNLAIEIGLSDNSVDTIYTCGLLHDVGKTIIPKTILNKNGPLNNDEWDVMKTHTITGYMLLKNSKYKKASIVALTHHEKWDGTGYPFGLKKNDIPLESKIISVVDVFDALRSKRAYKESWKLDRVVDYMMKERELHFDPDVLDVFLKKLPNC
ncbi:HD domain-containing phosphohydrolase [Sulfurimonas sp.]|uniref:HD-GYP domain-containing protein n=1 Tax=Sulfurimonas sp. TaxID=2022749 RepID=UPI0025E315BC|nr:HD domain-containing phosphohydrolase [Sulfurimonas sp.]